MKVEEIKLPLGNWTAADLRRTDAAVQPSASMRRSNCPQEFSAQSQCLGSGRFVKS
jgi:hypothetical protein